MSDEIFFDGVRYISAGDAGSLAGLTRDYVARLCKEGKVLGKRIGKQWYVDSGSFQNFVLVQEHARAKRREELVQTRKLEHHTGEILRSPAEVANHRNVHGSENVSRSVAREHAPAEVFQPAQSTTYVEQALRSALARAPLYTHSRVANIAASAPVHAVSIKGHVGTQVLAPTLEFLHRLLAVAVAVFFTLGTYVLVDAQYSRIADRSSTLSAALVTTAQEQLAAVAENPSGVFADVFRNFAKAFNSRVDSFVYSVMFPRSLAENSDAQVNARVVPTPRTSPP